MAKKTISGVNLGDPPPEAKPERKTKPGKTMSMGIRLPVELVADLDKVAVANHVSRTALVRYALGKFIEDLAAGRVELPKRTVTVTDI